jgi:3-phenylpropionate/cinnamic acid dioxygenase small subunit
MDADLVDEWVDCFTNDGVWQVVTVTRSPSSQITHPQSGVRWAGHVQLRHGVTAMRAGDRSTKHLVVDPRISVTGDSAQATSYFMILGSLAGRPHIRATGSYRDELRRVDGAWRFASRTVEIEAVGDGSTSP